MHKLERFSYILKEINKSGTVLVKQIAEELDVSSETVRRDLKELESQNKLIRMFGGAYIQDDVTKEVPNILKESMFKEEKNHMAILAVNYLKDDDMVFLDSTTTCAFVAKEILSRNLKVSIVTYSLDVAMLFNNIKTNTKLIMLGGIYRQYSNDYNGQLALNNIREFYADYAIISCASLQMDLGLFANTSFGSSVRRSMIKYSAKQILVADRTKFNSKSDFKICELNKIKHIITDSPLKPDKAERFEHINVRIEY